MSHILIFSHLSHILLLFSSNWTTNSSHFLFWAISSYFLIWATFFSSSHLNHILLVFSSEPNFLIFWSEPYPQLVIRATFFSFSHRIKNFLIFSSEPHYLHFLIRATFFDSFFATFFATFICQARGRGRVGSFFIFLKTTTKKRESKRSFLNCF